MNRGRINRGKKQNNEYVQCIKNANQLWCYHWEKEMKKDELTDYRSEKAAQIGFCMEAICSCSQKYKGTQIGDCDPRICKHYCKAQKE